MDHNDLAAELPPPRDDEPETLRRDIIDELADHLQCALNRELLAGGGRQSPDADIEQSAWQRVVTRFGSPAAVARRLWLDAMKERLMSQKLTAIMATLAAAACILMAVLVWQSTLRDSGAQSALLAQQQELNAALLRELKSIQTTSATAATNAGCAPVMIRLRTEAGHAVAGYVQIDGTAINAGNDNKVHSSLPTDASGAADFGLLPFGNYQLFVRLNTTGERLTETFMLSPGTRSERTIICPDVRPPEVDVTFDVDPPEPLHADKLVFLATVLRLPRKTASGDWSLTGEEDRIDVVFAADGRVMGKVVDSFTVTQPQMFDPFGGFPGSGGSTTDEGEPVGLQVGAGPPFRAEEYTLQGMTVAARLPDEFDDPTRLLVSTLQETYTPGDSEDVAFSPEASSSKNRWVIRPPADFWTNVIAAFRGSEVAAFAAIPDGWQVIRVPADMRNVVAISPRAESAPRRPFLEVGGRADIKVTIDTGAESEGARAELVDSPPEPLTLVHSAVVTWVHARQVMAIMSGSRSRFGRGQAQVPSADVKLLVDDEMAEAIKLATSRGTLQAVPSPEGDARSTSLNAEALEMLQQFPAADRE